MYWLVKMAVWWYRSDEDGAMVWWYCVDGVVGGQRTMGAWFWYPPTTQFVTKMTGPWWTRSMCKELDWACFYCYYTSLSCLLLYFVMFVVSRGCTTFCCIVSLGCFCFHQIMMVLSHFVVCVGCDNTMDVLRPSVQLLKYSIKTFALQIFWGICVF